MYPKRKADFSEVPEDKRLRADLADLFLSNQVAATRAGGLFKNAMASHATNVEDLAAVGEKSKQGIRNRGLTRRLLKGHHWPKTYLLSGPGLNPDTQEEQTVQIPLWLPHEMLSVLVEKSFQQQRHIRFSPARLCGHASNAFLLFCIGGYPRNSVCHWPVGRWGAL